MASKLGMMLTLARKYGSIEKQCFMFAWCIILVTEVQRANYSVQTSSLLVENKFSQDPMFPNTEIAE